MGRHINIELRAETALKNMTIRQALVLRDLVSAAVEDLVIGRISDLEAEIRDVQTKNGGLALVNADLERRLEEVTAAVEAERASKVRLEAEIAELRARLADGAVPVEEQSDLAGGLDEVPSAAVSDVLCVADADEASVAAEIEDVAADAHAGSDAAVAERAPAERQSDALGENAPAQNSADGETFVSQDCDPCDTNGPAGSEGADAGTGAAGDRRAGRSVLIEGALETRHDLLVTARAEHASLRDARAQLEDDLRDATAQLDAERQGRMALEEMAAALRRNSGNAEELTVAA